MDILMLWNEKCPLVYLIFKEETMPESAPS